MSNAVETGTPLADLMESRQAAEDLKLSTIRCVCRAVGLRPNSAAENLACVILKVCGTGEVFRRTIKGITQDRDMNGCSGRTAGRAIETLVEIGFLVADKEPPPAYRVRGSMPDVWLLRLRTETIFEVYYQHTRRVAMSTQKPPINEDADHVTLGAHKVGGRSAEGTHKVGGTSAEGRRLGNHTYYPPIEPLPPSPPVANAPAIEAESAQRGMVVAVDGLDETKPPQTRRSDPATWIDAESAVRDAGIGQWARLVDVARGNGYTPAELIDDAYVVRHCDKIDAGALMYRVGDRGRCWPASGVPDIETLRERRQDAANRIRAETARHGREHNPDVSDAAIAAVSIKRLMAAGYGDLVEPEEVQLAREATTRKAVTA